MKSWIKMRKKKCYKNWRRNASSECMNTKLNRFLSSLEWQMTATAMQNHQTFDSNNFAFSSCLTLWITFESTHQPCRCFASDFPFLQPFGVQHQQPTNWYASTPNIPHASSAKHSIFSGFFIKSSSLLSLFCLELDDNDIKQRLIPTIYIWKCCLPNRRKQWIPIYFQFGTINRAVSWQQLFLVQNHMNIRDTF